MPDPSRPSIPPAIAVRRPARPAARGVALLALAASLLPACPWRSEPFPAAALRERLERHLDRSRDRLREFPTHYALVFALEPAHLEDFMRQIRVHPDGDDAFVLGTPYAVESHGGGVLALLLDEWRPEGRAARLDDRYPFAPRGTPVALRAIYDGHRRQIFLPVPGVPTDGIEGRLPDAPQLARMRFRFWSEPEPVERDAYRFLGVLATRADDPDEAWRNRLGQTLSVDLLMRHALDHYLSGAGAARETEDHSNLHLVEVLLEYDRRRHGDAAEAIRRRFLAVELERRDPGEAWLEVLGHHVDSLGALVADPRLRWSRQQSTRVRDWLARLDDDERLRDLDALELQPLCHMLRGLRRIDAHRDRLASE